jgi:hypothetical protein
MEEGEIRDSPPPVQRQARAQVEPFITVLLNSWDDWLAERLRILARGLIFVCEVYAS